MAKIEIIDASPQLKPDGSLAVNIQAALIKERQDGVQRECIRIPNISFRIKSALVSATAVSRSNGVMIINNFIVGKAFEDQPPENLEIMAVYTNPEDLSEVVIKGMIEIGEKLRATLALEKERREEEVRKREEEVRKREEDRVRKIEESAAKLKAIIQSSEMIFSEDCCRTADEQSRLSGLLDKLENIIRNASATPTDMAEQLARFSHPHDTEKILLCLAKMRPRFIINNLAQYQDQPWAKKVYLSVAIEPNVNNAGRAEEQRLLKKKITEIGEMLCNMQDCCENDSKKEELVKYLMRHKFHPQVKVVLSILATRNPKFFLEYIEYYKYEPWIFEILGEMTKSDTLLCEYFRKYIDRPWAKDVLVGIAHRNPRLVVYLLKEFAEFDWAKEIMKIIALKHPKVIFSDMAYIEYYHWAEEVVGVAATQDPKTAFEQRGVYSQQPWAQTVVRISLRATVAIVEKNRHTNKPLREV